MLLNRLPDAFENFCIAIESRDQIPGIDFIKGKLLEEEVRRESGDNQHSSNSTRALVSRGTHQYPDRRYKGRRPFIRSHNCGKDTKKEKPVSERFNGKCFHCDKFGHRAMDCRKKKHGGKDNGKANQAQEEKDETTVALSATTTEEEDATTVALPAITIPISIDEWYLDSGATAHMCSTHECFDV